MRNVLALLIVAAAGTLPAAAAERPPGLIRIATFNCSLNRPTDGGLIRSLATPDDAQRRDHPGLRGEQQGLATLADGEGLDVVRDHSLQVVGGIGSGNAQVRAGETCNGR